MPNFGLNARVRIIGLQARPDLNEQEAVVLLEQKERWAVRCTLSNECVKIKPVNLILCEDRLTVLEDDMLLLTMTRAGPAGLRNAAVACMKLRSLCSRLLANAAYRRRCDREQLALWKASSPVFGFLSFDWKRDPSPPWGPSFEGQIDCMGSRIVHVDSMGRASLYENGSDGACQLVRSVSGPFKAAKRASRFHRVALSSSGRLAGSTPETYGVDHLRLYTCSGALEHTISLRKIGSLAWVDADTLVLIDEGTLCRWAPGLGPVLEFLPGLGTCLEVVDAKSSLIVSGSSDGFLSVWVAGTPSGALPRRQASFASGHEPETASTATSSAAVTRSRSFSDVVLSGAAQRIVSLGCDAMASEDDNANQIRVHDVATGLCIGSVAYRDELRRMPWFPGTFQFVWPADEADEHEGEPELHSLTCCAMRGESMLVTADDSGCVCVWDVGGGEGICRVASLPPPDAESPYEHLIKGIAIIDPAGGVDGLAGGSVLYSMASGDGLSRLEKMAPLDKGKLSRLTEQVEWAADEVPAFFRHDNLDELHGAVEGLSALGVADVPDATVPPPPPH